MNSNFSFVPDKILRKNLDICFDHILDLLGIAESESYQETLLVSSLRKTIVIHTASIIEALLLWKLKKETRKKEFQLSSEWKYFDVVPFYEISKTKQVVGAKRKKARKKIGELNFSRINDLALKHKIVDSKIYNNLEKVREMRNKLHLGSLREIEKEYKHQDLEFVFGVAKKVKTIVSE